MKNSIFSSFQRLKPLRMFVVSILTATVIMINLIDPLIRAYRENSFVEGMHIDLLMKGIQSTAYSSFIPIISIVPFGGCYVDELKSKYARFALIRSSYSTYIYSHIVVGFLSGSLVILTGSLMIWGAIAGMLIPIEQKIEGVEPYVIDGLIEIYVLLFVNGGLWSVVGMAMSTFMESKYIAYASPFVIYYMLLILCERYFPDAYLLYPPNWTNPDVWPYGAWGAAIFLLELTLVFSILFFIRAGRRLREL